ncbi:unnamed protein product [Cryptosporidium hominis]|uniref:Secreted Protein (WYLE family) n=2 Tax=Cryptosporidium hominis TaxID=237895 RepID=A0A0S4TFL1_CRYHO|nr:hypothetical protein ChTU502y2012_374g0375 [Cryptosporidium hominis]PPA64534.1 hypothetical protein ChUKH1_03190 [Cryptosporidium hominis]PPS96693.1 putative Secreted Protein (WYLE family) [Cryptosporidium hominis]CUV06262.1 unnamed protein product [Cryptosporidium hominis]|eukprot:PPS96693.1 putative Secreted Protein (WYLE family) [Cryptosporidium hominis]
MSQSTLFHKSVLIFLIVTIFYGYQIKLLECATTNSDVSEQNKPNSMPSAISTRHATSLYENLVPKHPQTSTSLLYGRMKVRNWLYVTRRNKEVGALRYGLNNDDMHVTIQMYVNNLKTHIPVQKTYLHERRGKARKYKRKYMYWIWRRWRYLLSAKERMPILVEDKDLKQMPIDPLERVYSYAVNIIEVPNAFYLEQVHCMYTGIKPFINGILPSYSLQDLIGASLYSIGPDGIFKDYFCIQAINLWSDDQIVPNANAICERTKKCLDNREVNERKTKQLFNEYVNKISMIYSNKRFIGADSGYTFASNAFLEMVQIFHELEAHKRPDYIEKLFVIVRSIRFLIYANELLLRSGVKNKAVFKASNVSDVIQYSVFRVDPVSMIRFCVAHFITTRFKFRKNMGIAVIEEACAHSLSFGFIDDTGQLPRGVTKSKAREIIYQHFSTLEEEEEHGDNFVLIHSQDQNISIDEKGNISRNTKKKAELEDIQEADEESNEELEDEENWNTFVNQYIE